MNKITETAHSLLLQFFPDEVSSKLAAMLGELVDFVGNPRSCVATHYVSEAHATLTYAVLSCREAVCLLPPLQTLCNYDETVVREVAVNSLNLIAKKLPSDVLKAEFVPMVQKLAGNADWWAPRVSACGLIHTAYAAYKDADEWERKKIVELFKVSYHCPVFPYILNLDCPKFHPFLFRPCTFIR